MVCPRCQQSTGTVGPEGKCALCGMPLAAFRQRLTTLYVLAFAFFVSNLVYGLLVYQFESGGVIRPGSSAKQPVAYVLLVVAVLLFGLAVKVGQRLAQTTTSEALQRLFIVKLTLIEMIVVCGLVVYVVLGSLQWFVTFLALGLLGFGQAGAQMPAVIEQLMRLAVMEAEQ